MDFDSLGIEAKISARLQRIGVVEPTPIQQFVVPHALLGEDILARSQTGSGKTLAYLLPIIQRFERGQKALILAPTRELVRQIAEVCREVCELECAVIYGGVEYEAQREALAQSPDIIIATVGRLKDLVEQGVADISQLDYFVLDEVDQMVDLGFRDDILRISANRKGGGQTLCFSATLPEAVEEVISRVVAEGYFRADSSAEALVVERIEQIGYYVTREMMDHLLIHLLSSQPPQKGIIFTRSRKMADRLSLLLRERGVYAEVMHSDRSQAAREHILSRFRSGETTLLVATDVIARGIDVGGVDVVYNYGLPLEAEQYIHRIGRTARAGKEGRAVSLCEPSERSLVDGVCKLMRRHIKMSATHPYATSDLQRALSASTQPPQRRRRG